MTKDHAFRYAVDGLLVNVRLAADPTYPIWSAYSGDAVGRAVWTARYCVREARVLGLYPPTAVLAAECRAVA